MPGDELRDRGQAIFDRLRQQPSPSTEAQAEDDEPRFGAAPEDRPDSGDGTTTTGPPISDVVSGEPPLAEVDATVLVEPEPDHGEGPPAGVATALEQVAELVPEATAEVPPAAARTLPRVLAIANQKGGVGKTTTAVNLGASLAELGYRVLVVDLDPQANATTGLGINPRNLDGSIYDVLMHDTPLEDCIEPTSLRNLFAVPATIDLAGAEIELVPAFSRELKLRRALEPALDEFEFVLIDCPPSLGLITVNGLAAAGEVVVPIQCEYYALEGLGQLLRNVNLVTSNLNPRLELGAIVLTMYDARTKLSEQVVKEVRAHFGAKVCRNIVPGYLSLLYAITYVALWAVVMVAMYRKRVFVRI